MRHVMRATNSETYELVIIALKDTTPAEVRLQLALKALLRSHRFRCKSVRPVELKKKRTTKAPKKQERGPRGPSTRGSGK